MHRKNGLDIESIKIFNCFSNKENISPCVNGFCLPILSTKSRQFSEKKIIK